MSTMHQLSNEKLFVAGFENTAVGVFLSGKSGEILYANATLEAMLGYERGELVGKTFLDITHPDDVAESRKRWDAGVGRTNVTGKYEKRYLTKDSKIIWVAVTVSYLKPEDESLPLCMAVVQDITNAKQTLEKLKESERIFLQLTQNISAVFWMTDPEKNTMIYVSPAYEEIWGRSCASLYAQPSQFLDAIHPLDKERVRAALPSQAEGKFLQEYRIIRPNGEIRYIRDKAYPVRNEQGEIYRICGIAEDITGAKETERLLADNHTRLIASSKMSTLGIMAGGLAHEINSPLSAMKLNIELMSEMVESGRPDLASLGEIVQTLDRTVIRLTKIVRSLRAIGRDGKNDPFEKVRVDSIIEDAVELCQEKMRHHSISLSIGPVPPNTFVHCRSVQISQVLLNLLINAYDAIEGLEEKWIFMGIVDLGEFVELSVTDSGPGIPKSIREKIFVPFFTTKGVGKGTGLGLPICASIIEDHRGSITIDENCPNTRFVIKLPKWSTASEPELS